MLDKQNLHQKVQELIECHATTNPLEEMSKLPDEADQEEAALKWLALAVLHGVNAGAEKIKLKATPTGETVVEIEYREGTLPSPGPELGPKIIEAARGVSHIDAPKGKVPLAVGVGNDSMMLELKVKDKDEGSKLSLKFPG